MTDPLDRPKAPGAPGASPTAKDDDRPAPPPYGEPSEADRFAHLHDGEWVAMDFDERAWTCAQCGISLRI